MRDYFWNIFVAASILLGAIFYGTYKTTLSANMGGPDQNILEKSLCYVLDIVLNEKNHCVISYNEEFKIGQ